MISWSSSVVDNLTADSSVGTAAVGADMAKTNSKSRLLLQIDTLLDRTACLLSLGAGLAQDGGGACIAAHVHINPQRMCEGYSTQLCLSVTVCVRFGAQSLQLIDLRNRHF